MASPAKGLDWVRAGPGLAEGTEFGHRRLVPGEPAQARTPPALADGANRAVPVLWVPHAQHPLVQEYPPADIRLVAQDGLTRKVEKVADERWRIDGSNGRAR